MEDKEIVPADFPSNSVTKKPANPAEKNLEKVVTGSVKQQKRGLGRRIAETFIEDNTKTVGDYVVHDVLVPAAKTMISDMVGGGIEMLLFGGRRGSRTTRDGGRSYVNYNSLSYRPQNREVLGKTGGIREISRTSRARHDFGEIILETRGEAEEVLSLLVEAVDQYGVASVADLYELVGIASSFTDNKYGWTDLRNAGVNRVRGGYLINLPRTVCIE